MPSDNRGAVGTEVREAVALCRAGRWREGREALARLSRLTSQTTLHLPAEYYAYLGYCVARFDHRTVEGVQLCEHAVALDPENPDALLCLARVHKLANHRRQGIQALKKGLRFEPHNDDLLELHLEYGVRRPPAIPFLARDNPVNVVLGRWRHRLARPRNEYEE